MPANSNRHVRLQEKSFNSILVALSIGGAALVLLREINYGVGLGSDARGYVAIARSLLEGNSSLNWDGVPITKVPPLLSVILAFFGLFGFKVITIGAYVNIFAFGMIILTTTVWLKSYVKSRLLIIWAGCAIALWVPLADLAAIIMSETLFILFIILALYTLDRFIITSTQSMMILSAACASLAWLTRYQGIAVVATALTMIFMQKGCTFKMKARQTAIYAAITGLPMASWIVRNLLISGTFAGSREGFYQLKQDPLIWDLITSELIYWTLGYTGSEYFTKLLETIFGINEVGLSANISRTIILLAIALSIGYLFMYLYRRYRWDSAMAVAVPACFAFIYAVITAIPPILQYEIVAVRYLIPLYIPLLIAVVMILDRLIELTSQLRWMSVTITAVLSIWLVQYIPENYRNINDRINNGFGAASKIYAKSDTIRYLKSNPLNGRIFSTKHWVAFFNDMCIKDCTLEPLHYLRDQDGKLVDPRPADEPLHIVVLQQDDYYSLLIELTELPALEIVSINLDGIVLKLAPDIADTEKSLLLNQDMIADMVLSNPNRFDGRLVLEKLPLELR